MPGTVGERSDAVLQTTMAGHDGCYANASDQEDAKASLPPLPLARGWQSSRLLVSRGRADARDLPGVQQVLRGRRPRGRRRGPTWRNFRRMGLKVPGEQTPVLVRVRPSHHSEESKSLPRSAPLVLGRVAALASDSYKSRFLTEETFSISKVTSALVLFAVRTWAPRIRAERRASGCAAAASLFDALNA